MSEVDEALAAFEAAVEADCRERAESEWADAMRFCAECKGWVNRYMTADVVRVCPRANLCRAEEV